MCLLVAQKNLLEEYEAAYELFKETDKEVHVLRRAIQLFISGKTETSSSGDSNRAAELMKLHLNELRVAWQHEGNL